jgi:bisanhydrobacterioruberin hydratase
MLRKYWPEHVLILITFLGVVGFVVGIDSIVTLTPLYLLVNIALLYARMRISKSIFLLWVTAAGIGFGAELLGVHTGILFGQYEYGSVLGPAVWGVPILVGVLWALVCSAIWSVLPSNLGIWRVALVGVVAVCYDIALEHFATRYGLWRWQGSIPISNSIGWLLVSSLIAYIYHLKDWTVEDTILARIILPVHTVFFIALLIL